VAKEQGLRSRAAFKLSQINRKHGFLEKSKNAILDLCAAPGGWTQIASRTCPNNKIPIVAVDILPIRPIHNNITTIIGDITTDKCQADIKRALKGTPVDVVLHDGAPNVGAEFGKDAYLQNELVLSATLTATKHLIPGGTFVTKVYRSRDYAKLQWAISQLFESVNVYKPAASRPQSAEIFWICEKFKAAKADPKLLDPKFVFADVEGETTGGGNQTGAASSKINVLKRDETKRHRHRSGYDHEHLDFSMRHVEPVQKFVDSASFQDAVDLLGSSTSMEFACETCKSSTTTPTALCHCNLFKSHPLTTPEIKACLEDLQVLNKSDFKEILNWRTKMQQVVEQKKGRDYDDSSDDDNEDDADDSKEKDDSSNGKKVDSDDEEEEDEDKIQAEIEELKKRRQREKKRKTKKERAEAAKRRKRAALGLDLNAIDIEQQHDQIFRLSDVSKHALEAASEVNLDRVTDEQILPDDYLDGDIVIAEAPSDDENAVDEEDEDARRLRRERDLDDAYERYLNSTRDGQAKSGTKFAKRSKKLQRQKIVEEAMEDQDMAMIENMDYNAKTYAKLLTGGNDSEEDASSKDDEDDEDDGDDGFHSQPMTPEEFAVAMRKKDEDRNPLIHRNVESTSAKTARWFSNPLFASIGEAAQQQEQATSRIKIIEDSDVDDDEDSDAPANKKSKKDSKLSAEEVLASMPKTGKQIRHEKRLKQRERDNRKKERRAKKQGETEEEFHLVPADNDFEDSEHEVNSDQKLEHLSEAKRKKMLEARELIKAGLGHAIGVAADQNDGIELVSQEAERPMPVMDNRKYDSDHEDYDSDDYAETLALGTMILRKSKEKAFVDASYNRYAWNDPAGLPEWLMDDEKKHYRPQLPIPPALLQKMKEKMMALSQKPIAKVAEARARKSKRAKAKLAAAKKKAEAVANSSDMSEATKLKAISKALRGQEAKKPSKTYVVARKGRVNKAGKGVKLVDKRMKKDKRGMDRADQRKKGSKSCKKH
jgi:AdoMet-dependent rRNA methyltransferase SPB1